MRYALLSDVHANLPALEAVLAHLGAQPDVAGAFHLGDLVGYAPWPDETVRALRDAGVTGVAGNYDSTVATNYKHCGCRYEDARQEALSHVSYEWTREHSSAETKSYLRALPFRLDIRPLGGHLGGPTITLVHGNHALNTVYVHEGRSDDFLEGMGRSLGATPGDVVCFGHTHVHFHRAVGGVHFVNTGSVGRPRDGDPRAGYVLLDIVTGDVRAEYVRVAYDVDRAVRAIVTSGLPDDFASHLRHGGPTVSPALQP